MIKDKIKKLELKKEAKLCEDSNNFIKMLNLKNKDVKSIIKTLKIKNQEKNCKQFWN